MNCCLNSYSSYLNRHKNKFIGSVPNEMKLLEYRWREDSTITEKLSYQFSVPKTKKLQSMCDQCQL